MAGGQEHFGIGLDVSKLQQDAEKAKKAFDGIAEEAKQAGNTIDNAFEGKNFSDNLKKQFSDISKIATTAFDGVSDNAQRMIKEIQESTLQLRNVERLMSELNASYENGTISQNDYINAAARLTVVHEKISKSIRDTEAALKAETTVIDKLADDSMTALQAKVTLLTTEYMKLSKAQRESIEGETLLKNISEVNAELNRAQATMSKYGATAAGNFNTLNVSIQQIARELPSLTMSPQMFFLAISNNIPMFTDALVQARKEYEAMTASGQKGIPVWKQVAKAILSWQTALSLIPTLLLVFGDDIAAFFDNIFKGSEKVDYAGERIKAFRETMLKGTQNAQKEITDLKLLYEATQDVSKSIKERTDAADELQRKYPDYFGNMSNEEVLAGKAADAYKRLSTSIIAAAKAQAARDRIVTEQSKILEYEQKLADANARLEKETQTLQKNSEFYQKNARNLYGAAERQLAADVSGAKARVDALKEEIKGYEDAIKQSNAISKQLQESINVSDLIVDSSKSGKGNKGSIDNLKQYLNELLGLQEDNEERQIELTKTGTEKQLALIDLRYKRQIEAVKKLQEELKKAQGGKLTDEQQGIFGTALSGLQGMQQAETTAVQNKELEAERKAMQEYLAEYGDYWNKRKAIAEKYQDEIAKATTEGDRLSLQAEMTQTLAKLDDEAQKKTSIIVKLFGNMADKSVAEMRAIAKEAENLLSFIEGGQYQSGNAFGITEEQFKVLSKSPDELDKIREAIERIRNEADNLEPTFTKIGNLIKDVLNPGNANLGDTLKSLQSEVGSVTQAVSTLANSFAQIGQAFGSDALSSVAEGFNAIGNAANQALSGAISGFVLGGPIGAGIGAVTGMVSSLASTFAKIHDKKNEKRIQRLQDQIDVLTESYDDLGRSIEKAYSKDASKLIEDQNKLLEQQKVLIRQQIAEERDKKDSDENRIKEWEQLIQDINDAIEDNKQAAIDAIFGEDVQSAIERFASSLTDAWAQGTDATESARDAVKTMMKQMVTESIKSAIQASGSMEKIRQKLQQFYADNVLTGWEQDYIYNMAEELQDELDRQFGWAEDLFKDKTDTSQQATSRGFETMSQDTADELNGRFTALYESNLRIENQISIGNVNLQATKDAVTQMRDITQNCYLELVEIRENTGAVVKPISQMQKDMAEMKNVIKERL